MDVECKLLNDLSVYVKRLLKSDTIRVSRQGSAHKLYYFTRDAVMSFIVSF